MLFPDKLFTYEESIISKFPSALNIIKEEPISASNLFIKLNNRITGISEFMDLLDCLYALGKIELNENEGVICYVERNIL